MSLTTMASTAGRSIPVSTCTAGYLLVRQAAHYGDLAKRLALARELVRASAHSIGRNIAYYSRRKDRPGSSASDDHDPPGEVGLPPEDAPPAPASALPTDAEQEAALDAGAYAALTEPADPDPDPFETAFDFDLADADTPPGPPSASAALAWLGATIASLADLSETVADVDALRGVEGKMRERYYRAWPHIPERRVGVRASRPPPARQRDQRPD